MQWLLILEVCLCVLGVLIASELGWRKGWLRGEFGRKFVHITVGTFVAFWPWLLEWNEIRLLSLAFFFGVIASFRLGLFSTVSTYQRPTYGEVLFALSVGFLTLITESKGIYAAAILQMALADGMAAVVGKTFGKSNRYHVFGKEKSLVGTLAFFAISLALLLTCGVFSAASIPWTLAIGLALSATLIENISLYGLDNLLVPVFVGLFLQNLS